MSILGSLSYRRAAKLAAAIVFLLALVWLLLAVFRHPPGKEAADPGDAAGLFDPSAAIVEPGLPPDSRFQPAAESASLRLLVDSATAHFQVESKSTGQIWHSYPQPQHWELEKSPNAWRNNLASPIMVEYVNAKNYKSLSMTTSLIEAQGYLENFRLTGRGFAVTFALPKVSFKIPIEVSLHDDYVETRIIDAGITEGALSLLTAKLYPLLGAQPSVGQEGYLLLPDGAGALIHFERERVMQQLTYNESVYGSDYSFYNEYTGRQRISLPVYGLKSGDQAFVAVITEGEEFANVYAAPSGAVGSFNWITTEWQYRKRFFQIVSHSTGDGFYTYSNDKLLTDARATRYYPLSAERGDYVGMAGVYRSYLIDEQGVEPLTDARNSIPLSVSIVGADIEQGLFLDSYLIGTTTAEAQAIIGAIHARGIRNIRVHYSGWQQDGYTTEGGYFPVDSRLGGTKGMREFVDYAHSLHIPVFLTAKYSRNNTGKGGFWWRRDGLRNLAGTVLKAGNLNYGDKDSHLVSPGLYARHILDDLDRYRQLGVDGIHFIDGVGQTIVTDFNSRYPASREDVADLHRDILARTRAALGQATAYSPNAYALKDVDHVDRLISDYSYDVFVSEPVPFSQIVLHGLRPYTHEWSNVRDEYRDEFLRSIEYGAYPAYVLTGDAADDFRRSYSIWYYSTAYSDWLDRIAEEYAAVNEALAEVQDQFITGHRKLADNVKETAYGDRYRIVVNYNDSDYRADGIVVPARDFVVVKGGAAP